MNRHRRDSVLAFIVLAMFIIASSLLNDFDKSLKASADTPQARASDFHAVEDKVYVREVQSVKTSLRRSYSDSELKLLASIIFHESIGESVAGKLAVGTVIMNRAKQNPKLISSVVYQPRQFLGVSRGYIKRVKPDKESIESAKRVLEGYRSFNDSVKWYCNEKTATNHWMVNNLERVKKIGNHTFFKEDKNQ